jgi:hypothetical protein
MELHASMEQRQSLSQPWHCSRSHNYKQEYKHGKQYGCLRIGITHSVLHAAILTQLHFVLGGFGKTDPNRRTKVKVILL